jgi:cell division septal protein FtsQ
VDPGREPRPRRPEDEHERLRELERRVAELEHEARRRERASRRARLVTLVGAVLYLAFLYWQLTALA